MVVNQLTDNSGFKPYYNWNTFNTSLLGGLKSVADNVLNLIITGIPSIPLAC